MNGPVVQSERLESLDVLRGFAVLGILIMNIQAFANIDAAYTNPTIGGPFTGADYWIWYLSHLFAELKFMTIFSALFGAGIYLMTSRREETGRRARGLHYRRMMYLTIFGLIHAYLMWWGDILVWYGITGLWIFLFRKRRPRTLIIWGSAFVLLASLLSFAAGWTMPYWPEEKVAEFITEGWLPPPEDIQENLDVYRGDYWPQVVYRAPKVMGFQIFAYVFFGAWRIGGVMLLGMAMLRLGILGARRSRKFYKVMIALGAFIGLPMAAYGTYQMETHGWTGEYSFFFGVQYNYWGSLLASGGWIGVVMLLFKSGRLNGFVGALAAVGRMAFTNYIGQTVICTALFYGWGLGLFGYVDRTGQMLIVAAVFLLQLTVSPLWLYYFRYGPLEWLWRSLSYGSVQPLRARHADTVGPQ